MSVSPVAALARQIEQHPGRRIDRIRIHPTGWETMKRELAAGGFVAGGVDMPSFYGIPIVKDEQLVDGPIADFGITFAEWDAEIDQAMDALR